ncbi:PREDICTED: uncharacterized protein LOC104607116 [Nelumbo nucifera]|uniref:Uncharacterized protein LOC104607116 n=2 Tax=Nelumbo nucifera TaxID=4432 RepID=A0A1U8ASK5_NELNU|nr:PREDICTED: uncharacterized protein LOC104607116 [Nelumbo nucifera]DAD38408.1 TPA_asm: hypothetical protein HUJ06_009049 [Nelumbo nucifera]
MAIVYPSPPQKDRPLHLDVANSRDAPPAHYIFKIRSFSLLSKASVEKYDSDVFEVGGYKWKLSLYPDGNKVGNGSDHISLYLVLADSSLLQAGSEVNATFSLFLFDQLQDKYLTFQERRVRRFYAMRTEWGIARFIDLKTFKDPNNGYLVSDTCVFGAEIFIIKNEARGVCLSMEEGAVACTHTWKMEKFSGIDTERLDSEAFLAGDYKWKIRLYPKGIGDGKGNSISLFLALADSTTLPPDTKVYTKLAMRIMDQASGAHSQEETYHLFSPSVSVWGWPNFMTLAKLNDQSTKSFLRNGSCIFQAEVTVLGSVSKLA